MRGLVLFAHGSREAGWADLFERLAARVRLLAGGREVRLAFLEIMHPDLAEAVAELAGLGIAKICVVPVFLGSGGHLQRDLPHMIDELRSRHPGVRIECARPAGEDESVLEAIARYCASQIGWPPNDV